MTSADIKAAAGRLGFDLCGVAPAEAFAELGHFDAWLARGYAGEMAYLHRSADARADVRRFLPAARSVIVTATVYLTDEAAASPRRPSGARRAADAVKVARYARGDDYHRVLSGRLESLLGWIRTREATPFEAAVFVDKHHVQERVYAAYAGIGWVGKNACLIHPERGSWLLLGGIATSLPLAPDAPLPDQCGSCTRCLDSCPTGALVEPRVLDATRCISYLTIELEGPVPTRQRPDVGHHLYGCDVCQEVCPWNTSAPASTDPIWRGNPRDGVGAADLWQRTDQQLHDYVRGSAMTYTSVARLRRTLAIIIGNSGDSALADVLDRPGGGLRNAAHSAYTPLVQDAVAWARARLHGPARQPAEPEA